MPICPVCQQTQNLDELAFTHHVNSHFAEDAPGPSRTIGSRGQANGHAANGRANGPTRSDSAEATFCPICNFPLSYVSPAESTRHVEACLNSPPEQPSRPGFPDTRRHSSTIAEENEQDFAFDDNTLRTNGQSAGDDWVEVGWDGPAKPGAWSGWVSKKVDKGDKWWDPVHGSKTDVDIPPNFSPGVVPVLHQILQRSSAKGMTRQAVLSRDVTHIRYALTFDVGWGCGYRNALMALTSLIQAKPAYRKPFSEVDNGASPGVRRIQGWIEEAWSQGYDPEGKKHFKGKLLGSKKWIGTSDLYAMFVYKGIPCNLYDFINDKTKPVKNAHNNLVRWVKEYFDHERARPRAGQSAFNVLMRTDQDGVGRGENVRLSTRVPLILQHSGHSRLIIGYEETARGEIYLLLLDPGKTMHKDIRAKGIASLTPRYRRTSSTSLSASLSRHSSRKPSHESINFARPYTNGESEMTNSLDAPQLATSYTIGRKVTSARPLSAEQVPRLEGGAVTGTAQQDDEDDGAEEVMDERGWVRKRVKKVIHPRMLYDGEKWKVPDALQPFRVSAHHLSSHSEYQVLEFTGGPPLTDEEKQARKQIRSKCIK